MKIGILLLLGLSAQAQEGNDRRRSPATGLSTVT